MLLKITVTADYLEIGDKEECLIFTEKFDDNVNTKFTLSALNYFKGKTEDVHLIKYYDAYISMLKSFDIESLKECTPENVEEILNKDTGIEAFPFERITNAELCPRISEFQDCYIMVPDNDSVDDLFRKILNTQIKFGINKSRDDSYKNDKGVYIEISTFFNIIKNNVMWLINCTSSRDNRLHDFDEIELDLHLRRVQNHKDFTINYCSNIQK